MSHAGRTTMELVSIVNSGGSLKVSGEGRTAMELIAIATAAARSEHRPHVTFTNLGGFTTVELVGVASSGKGLVTLE